MNSFLFAPVGEEANGMELSVASVLARGGDDPWQAATRLAGLPRSAATASLAEAITTMPGGRWNPSDATQIATRLVGLLPAPAGAAPAPSRRRRRALWVALLFLVMAAVALVQLASAAPAPSVPPTETASR